MALMQPVENGKIVETESQSSLKNTSKNTNGMDKDAFLQLLVAQMRYQDPLEPTSNTEYVAQYAQFSQVEQLQNVANTMELQRAASLVGQEVYIKTTTSTGDVKYVFGKVDYVVYENGKAFLSIEESLYSLDDLDTVVDKTYIDAYQKAESFTIKLNRLPGIYGIDLSDAKAIEELREIYEGMNDYEKSFLATDTVKRYEKYIEKLKQVYAAAGLDEHGNPLQDPDEVDGDENVGGSGSVDGDKDVDGDENGDVSGGAGGNENTAGGTGEENGSTEGAVEP